MYSFRHISIYLGGFVGPLGGLAVLTLFPALKTEYEVGIELIQLSIPFFMLPFAFFQLFTGTFSDRVGRGAIAISGFVIYLVGSLLCTVSPDYTIFLGSRVVQGIGFAFVSPVLNAMIGDITPRRHMGTAMGLFGSSITLGIAMGPLVAGWVEEIDWRIAFYIFAILSVIEIFFLVAAFGKDFFKRTKAKDSVDMGKGIRKVLGNRNVVLLSAAGFFAFFAFIGPTTYLAERFSFMFDAKELGFILSSSGFVGIFWAPAAGRMVDKIGRIPVGAVGFAVMTIALLVIGYASSFWAFIGAVGLIGLGSATIWACLMTLSVEVVPGLKGTVSSVYNAVRFFGYALAPPLLLWVYLEYDILIVYIVGSISALMGLVMLRGIKVKERPRRPR